MDRVRSKSLARVQQGAVGMAFLCATIVAHAESLHKSVRTVADTGADLVVMIAGKPAQAIYVGEFNGCSQVAVQRQRSSQQNFEVCDGVVRDKSSVTPSWPLDSAVRQMLSMVVDQALRQGHSVASDANGYMIGARRQHDVGTCSSVVVTVTYDGDLVDRAVQRVCGHG